jgi:hypothetical protein
MGLRIIREIMTPQDANLVFLQLTHTRRNDLEIREQIIVNVLVQTFHHQLSAPTGILGQLVRFHHSLRDIDRIGKGRIDQFVGIHIFHVLLVGL